MVTAVSGIDRHGEHADAAHAADSDGHLRWKRTMVNGRTALYGEGGEPDGIPVVFLHGWALGQHTYKRPLRRLVQLGCHVYAPALPGFGGTPDLSRKRFSLGGYAEWVDAFMASTGITEPVLLIGHSFGGGVAIKLAHDHPARVRSLVLVNSIGGAAWTPGAAVRAMTRRPPWDWGLHLPADVAALPQLRRVLPVILEDALPNVVRNPLALWRVGQLARTADLTPELAVLREREVPVTVIWGDKDQIVPKASFDALCRTLGADCHVVPGNHAWLLADPDAFAEVMTNVVGVAEMAHEFERVSARRRRHRALRRQGLAKAAGVVGIGGRRGAGRSASVADERPTGTEPS